MMFQTLNAFFKIRESHSNLRRETLAGVTTFMAMAYIVFVNPAILSDAVISPDVPAETMFKALAAMFGAGLPQTLTLIVDGEAITFTDALYPVTAPALIVVGCLMMQSVKEVQWSDWTEAMPAFLTIILMPLTFSISTGLFAGMVAYPILKLATGRGREVHWLLYTLVIIFLASLVAFLVR